MMNQENETLIEKFLGGILTDEERKKFDEKMTDSEFSSEVAFYSQLRTAAINEGRSELKKKLEKVRLDSLKRKRTIVVPVWAKYGMVASIAIFICLSLIRYFEINSNKNNTPNYSFTTRTDTSILKEVHSMNYNAIVAINSDSVTKLKLRVTSIEKTGMTALKKHNYSKAIDSYEKIKQYASSSDNNYLGTARALYALSIIPGDVIYPMQTEYNIQFRTDVFAAPRNYDDFIQKKKNLLAAAQSDFENAIKVDPKDFKAYINLASVYDMQHRPQEAIETIKKLPDSLQNKKSAYLVLGNAYHHLKKEKDAKEMYDRAKNAKD